MVEPRVAFIGTGGAVKGLANVGVLRAMQELGLHAEVVIGASTGAWVGALYAQNALGSVDWHHAFARGGKGDRPMRARDVLGAPGRSFWRNPGYLASGLFSIDRFERLVADKLVVNDFRMLDKRLLITATDVDGRGRVVFGRGYREDVPISEAVAASSCLPILFRPYQIGDRYFVDGEIMRTLSIDLAVEAGADVIIISNVYRPHVARLGERSIAQGGMLRIGRQMLSLVLNEKEKRGVDLVQQQYPHVHVLHISPDLGRYPFLSTRHVSDVMRRSYREGLKVLANAKRRGVFDTVANVRTVGQA